MTITFLFPILIIRERGDGHLLLVEKMSEDFHETSIEKQSLTVLGIYKDLIYVRIACRVYAIQNRRIAMSPISVSIQDELDFRSLDLYPGDSGEVTPEKITIKSLVIDISNPKVISLKLSGSTKSDGFLKEIIQWEDLLREVMKDTLDEKSQLTAEGNVPLKGIGEVILGMKSLKSISHVRTDESGVHVQEIFTRRVNDFILKFQDGKETSFECLAHVIGLGPGLTPSGDDFLSGLLSLLWYLDEENEVSLFKNSVLRRMLPRADGTTPVSMAFLKAAMNGEFTESILDLYQAMGRNKVEESKEILREISKQGHSSGTDILAGILFGMIVVRKREYEELRRRR